MEDILHRGAHRRANTGGILRTLAFVDLTLLTINEDQP